MVHVWCLSISIQITFTLLCNKKKEELCSKEIRFQKGSVHLTLGINHDFSTVKETPQIFGSQFDPLITDIIRTSLSPCLMVKDAISGIPNRSFPDAVPEVDFC